MIKSYTSKKNSVNPFQSSLILLRRGLTEHALNRVHPLGTSCWVDLNVVVGLKIESPSPLPEAL
jgi:hypothetical protein